MQERKDEIKQDGTDKQTTAATVTLTPSEKEALSQLAKDGERTVSQQIRLLIRHVWEEPTTSSDARSRAAGDRCR